MSFLRHIHYNHNFHGDEDAPRFVIEGKQVVGMLSRHDVLKGMLELIPGLAEQPRE